MLLGFWLESIPITRTWLGSRGRDRNRSSSKSDTRGTLAMHLQPARASSLHMSFRSTSGQSEGEATHLVELRTSLVFPLQARAYWPGGSHWTGHRALPSEYQRSEGPTAEAGLQAEVSLVSTPNMQLLLQWTSNPSGLHFFRCKTGMTSHFLIHPYSQEMLWRPPSLLLATPMSHTIYYKSLLDTFKAELGSNHFCLPLQRLWSQPPSFLIGLWWVLRFLPCPLFSLFCTELTPCY